MKVTFADRVRGLTPRQVVGRTIYAYYQYRLLRQVRGKPMPQHIGIILDGNRRYARQQGWEPVTLGHAEGARKIDQLLDWCDELGVPVVTLWVLSTENLRRESPELAPLLEIIRQTLRRLAATVPHRATPRRIQAVSDLEALPASLREALVEAEAQTAHVSGPFLNLAVGYGGRDEIVNAVKGLLQDYLDRHQELAEVIPQITPDDIGRYLYTRNSPDPDLIIRTSGEVRLSGFLLWQSAYSEFYFCDAYWPAFRKIDFLRALRSFQQRKRRFGR